MDDLVIEKAVEKDSTEPQTSSEEVVISQAVESIEQQENSEPEGFVDPALKQQSNKTLFITLGVIVAVFALMFAGFMGYNSITGNVVLDMQGLHDANFEGDLAPEEGYLYNGFSFINVDGLWWTDIVKTIGDNSEKVRIPLHFGAREVEEVEVTGVLSKEFNVGEDVYVTIDPTVVSSYYRLSLSELSLNMAKGIGRRPIGSCTAESFDCMDRDIISCDNNPENLPVVEFVQDFDVDSQIELDGACIKITGHEYGIVKAVDKLLLQWYGII